MNCPICGYKDWKHQVYSEECWGVVEEHSYCERCGYTVEMAYSDPITGFSLDRVRGYKDKDGNWRCKNVRKRKRIRRKYGIKHEPTDWILNLI